MHVVVRPLVAADMEAAGLLAQAAFDDLDRQLRPWRPADAPAGRTHAFVSRGHFLDTDPDGQWVAEAPDGEVVGAASAIVTEGLWGLSLLAVRPGHQDAGIGRRLLERALQTLEGARGGIIISSPDPRAITAYARAGFDLHPTLAATGRLRRDRLDPPAGVRPGDADDLPLTERVDRVVRGAAHGRHLLAALEAGAGLLVSDRAYALTRRAQVTMVAAEDPAAAAEILRGALLSLPEDAEEVEFSWLTSSQQWAVEVGLAAGLRFRPTGPICTRGDVGPMTPYLPSGAYL
jgi:GNAT superfamily N-acetyltransferase